MTRQSISARPCTVVAHYARDPLARTCVDKMTSAEMYPDRAGPAQKSSHGNAKVERRFRVYAEAPGSRPGPR